MSRTQMHEALFEYIEPIIIANSVTARWDTSARKRLSTG